MQRPCLDCGTPTPRTRCALCTRRVEAMRGSRQERGYGAEYQRQRKALLDAEPWCHNPRCPSPDAGTPANPLTIDHIIPIAKGGKDGPLTVLCRSCNSSKGSRMEGD